MPKPKNVSLKIKDKQNQGWTETTANNGTKYWYKFQGGNTHGNNGDQDLDVSKDGKSNEQTFVVDLRKESGKDGDYLLADFFRAKDPDSQLSGKIADDGKSATVRDLCPKECQHMAYGFWVEPEGEPQRFLCDPRINNKM